MFFCFYHLKILQKVLKTPPLSERSPAYTIPICKHLQDEREETDEETDAEACLIAGFIL
jgi:hypothetical protein